MSKIFLVVVFLACLSGCIKIQMPDDLVSDTVDAIKGVGGDEPEGNGTDGASTFSHSIVGAANTSEPELKRTCRFELETRTMELLDTPDLTYVLISENISVTGDKAIASCTLEVQQTAGLVSPANQDNVVEP